MPSIKFKAWAIAAIACGVAIVGGSNRAAADIKLTVSTGATTQVYDIANNTTAVQVIPSIGGYGLSIQTVISSYPGTPGDIGSISTTVNVTSASTTDPLTIKVELVDHSQVGDPLLKWTGPSSSPVFVTASASFVPVGTVHAGTNTVTTYYDTPGAVSGPGTSVVSANQTYNNLGGTPGPNVVVNPNAGTYTLSQVLVLSGIHVGDTGYNFGGISQVSAVPEPSSMAIAGLGALAMIGYSFRRRKMTEV